MGRQLGLHYVAVGLFFDVGPDVFALFQVGGDDDLGFDAVAGVTGP